MTTSRNCDDAPTPRRPAEVWKLLRTPKAKPSPSPLKLVTDNAAS